MPVGSAAPILVEECGELLDDALVGHLDDEVAVDVLPRGAGVRRKGGAGSEVSGRPIACEQRDKK